ncbi:PucR family transcriptional regulator [Bailinhaonella thermotolerans]|uniref:PucR family transcriptional regulator n=1 Tax=Bailinhaonella thermotolerans TaxID=1070861 RepID=A0A3A4ARQ6_9ACTN|nr:PucR family transcriptional regulator [Bailinhaonella thermotolerans]RJL32538.1 PucR family transcriptional regulator [Bailinhaonella thermotolerans]
MLLRDLIDAPGLGLRLLTGEEHLDRPVVGVLTTDLPDPSRYLTRDELVLSGLMWRQDPEDAGRFVGLLVRAGVTALGAGQAWFGGVPDDVVEACRDQGLPLFAVPVEVSFGSVASWVGARLTGALALGRHRRLVSAVAGGAGLAELLTLVSTELGVSAAVVASATGAVVAGSLDEAEAVRLAREFRAAGRMPHLSRGPYTLFEVGARGVHRDLGWFVACAGDLTREPAVSTGYELADCAALERARREEGRRVERRLVEQLLVAAVRAEPGELAARLQACGLDPAEPYVAVSAAVAGGEARLAGQALEELLDVPAAVGADEAVAVLGGPGVAERLREGAERLALAGLCVGVSTRATGGAGLRGCVEEAGHARRLAESRGGGVVTGDEIYTHALLLATVPQDVRRSFAARLLEPVIRYDREHQSDLVRTLEAFLDCSGSWNVCAARLHIHVNTLRYRVHRIEELTGRDLGTLADRVDLFLALRAM